MIAIVLRDPKKSIVKAGYAIKKGMFMARQLIRKHITDGMNDLIGAFYQFAVFRFLLPENSGISV